MIRQPIEELSFAPGESLYQPGDAPKYLYTVRQGLLKLVQYLPSGDQRIVRLLKKGDVAGLEVLLEQPYRHRAVVLEPADVCRIPATEVNRLSAETPRLHHQLLSRWQQALSEADDWLTELSMGSARARLARLLLRLDQCCTEEFIHLPSREDIGAMLGITTETASRLVSEFKRKGYLKGIDPNRVYADLIALEHIATE